MENWATGKVGDFGFGIELLNCSSRISYNLTLPVLSEGAGGSSKEQQSPHLHPPGPLQTCLLGRPLQLVLGSLLSSAIAAHKVTNIPYVLCTDLCRVKFEISDNGFSEGLVTNGAECRTWG